MRSEIELRLLMLRLAVRGDRAIDAVKWPLAAVLFACAFGLVMMTFG